MLLAVVRLVKRFSDFFRRRALAVPYALFPAPPEFSRFQYVAHLVRRFFRKAHFNRVVLRIVAHRKAVLALNRLLGLAFGLAFRLRFNSRRRAFPCLRLGALVDNRIQRQLVVVHSVYGRLVEYRKYVFRVFQRPVNLPHNRGGIRVPRVVLDLREIRLYILDKLLQLVHYLLIQTSVLVIERLRETRLRQHFRHALRHYFTARRVVIQPLVNFGLYHRVYVNAVLLRFRENRPPKLIIQIRTPIFNEMCELVRKRVQKRVLA